MFQSRFWSLTFYKAYADLRAESERYYMAYMWWLIEPLMQMGVYYLIFGVLFANDRPGFITFLLVGLVIWRWWTAAVNEATQSILSNKQLVRMVYIPKWVFPNVSLLVQSFKFAVIFCILMVYLWIAGYPPSTAYFGLPFLFGSQFCLAAGVSYCTAAVVPFLPDLRLLVQTSLHLLFFLSGVFFDPSRLNTDHLFLFFLNPMARLLEAYRDVLIAGQWPLFGAIWFPAAIGLVFALIGLSIINRFDLYYPKVVR